MAEAIVTFLTKSNGHRAWHIPGLHKCGFARTKKSLVISVIASNYILELTFSYRGIGFPSPRGTLRSYHAVKSG